MPHCVVSNCPLFNYKKSNLQESNPHRMCSAHFAPNSYVVQDAKLVLRSDAVPTIFPAMIEPTANLQNFPSPPNSSGCQGEVWPKCIVSSCRQPIGGVLLHTFPNNLHRIKQWLLEKRRSYDYCMCSAHFSPECYIFQEGRAILRTNAMPTIFPSRPQAQQPQVLWNVWPPLMVAQVPLSAEQNSAPKTPEAPPPRIPKSRKKTPPTGPTANCHLQVEQHQFPWKRLYKAWSSHFIPVCMELA
ncbi:uncharacterized protein LOC116407955 [Xenopus tropicalis]|uniref:THAP domain-containing protein 1 n=1 Tax=Xenopus tropicalis TaxID=8364 RepID=A0A8J1IZS1_XENTR|nr:uncharacterized protein LOC116407955 [Xenopus tropicalis]